jgi:hypothetical protein
MSSNLFATLCVVSCLILTACEPRQGTPNDNPKIATTASRAPLPPNASDEILCRSTTQASDGGLASLQLAVLTNAQGKELWMSAAVRSAKPPSIRFAGTEQVSGICWAYAEIVDPLSSATAPPAWRCPVTIVRDSADYVGVSLLEEVESDNCEYNVKKGMKVTLKTASKLQRLDF